MSEQDLPYDQSGKLEGWIVHYQGKKLEIKKGKDANSLYDAKKYAIKKLNVPRSKQSMISPQPAYEEVEVKKSFNAIDFYETFNKINESSDNEGLAQQFMRVKGVRVTDLGSKYTARYREMGSIFTYLFEIPKKPNNFITMTVYINSSGDFFEHSDSTLANCTKKYEKFLDSIVNGEKRTSRNFRTVIKD